MVEALRQSARPVEMKEEVAAVASIAADDPETGQTIGDVMEKVGKDGVITVEESKGLRMEVEYVDGLQWDRGYISPYFVSNPDRMEAALEDPYILITDYKISAVNDNPARAGEGAADQQELRDRQRGRGRGGTRHPGGQQDARHGQRAGGEGARLR